MQTIHKLDEDDIISIIAEKFDVDENDINLSVLEEITTSGKRENIVSAKVFEENN